MMDLQKGILERVTFVKKEVEDEQDVEEEEAEEEVQKEPEVPPTTKVSISTANRPSRGGTSIWRLSTKRGTSFHCKLSPKRGSKGREKHQ